MTTMDIGTDNKRFRFCVSAFEFNPNCRLFEFVDSENITAMYAIKDFALIENDGLKHSIFANIGGEVIKLLVRLRWHYLGVRMWLQLLY